MPPAAMHECARDEGQVVVRVEAIQLRPGWIEIALGNQRVTKGELIGRLGTE